MARMAPLSAAAQAMPSLALREDAGAVVTCLRYPGALLATLASASQLTAPFSSVLDELGTSDKFVKNWLDLLCFLLQVKVLVERGGQTNALATGRESDSSNLL